MNFIRQFGLVFIEPAQVFSELKTTTGGRWPMVLLQVMVAAAVLWFFYQGMSTNHIVEQQLLLSTDLTPAEREQSRAVLGEVAPHMALIAAVMGGVTVLVVSSLLAIYYLVASRLEPSVQYGDWFIFTLWSQAPQLVNLLGLVVLVVLSPSADVPLSLANYASLNQLLNLTVPGDRFYNLLEAMNLFYLWQGLLATLGLKQWLQINTTQAAGLAALPYALVFGLWALSV